MPPWASLFAPRMLMQSSFSDMDLSDFAESIISMEYSSHVRKMDKCSLTIENRDARFSNDPRLDKEIRFLFKWGYPSGLTYARELLLVSVAPALSGGVPTLVWTAYGQGQMLQNTRSHNWGAVSSSSIARSIASSHGLTAEVVESGDARREHRIQASQTSDYEFLARLAERINYNFRVTRDTLTFIPIDTSAAPRHKFTYYVDGTSILKSFRPTVKKGRVHQRAVSGVGADGRAATPTARRQQRALGNSSVQILNTRTGRLGPRVQVSSDPNRVIHPTAETSAAVQRAHSSADNHAAEMGAVDMTAELVGYPTIEAADIIEMSVPDVRYSGLWRVREAKHVIDSTGEYDTSLRLHRAEVNSTGSATAATTPRNVRNNRTTPGSTEDDLIIDTPRSSAVRATVVRAPAVRR